MSLFSTVYQAGATCSRISISERILIRFSDRVSQYGVISVGYLITSMFNVKENSLI